LTARRAQTIAVDDEPISFVYRSDNKERYPIQYEMIVLMKCRPLVIWRNGATPTDTPACAVPLVHVPDVAPLGRPDAAIQTT